MNSDLKNKTNQVKGALTVNSLNEKKEVCCKYNYIYVILCTLLDDDLGYCSWSVHPKESSDTCQHNSLLSLGDIVLQRRIRK